MDNFACEILRVAFVLLILGALALFVGQTTLMGLVEELWLTDKKSYMEVRGNMGDSWLERGSTTPQDFLVTLNARRFLLTREPATIRMSKRRQRYRVSMRLAGIFAVPGITPFIVCLIYAWPKLSWAY